MRFLQMENELDTPRQLLKILIQGQTRSTFKWLCQHVQFNFHCEKY